MDMLGLEKLLESTKVVDGIAKNVTDSAGYNAVTKTLNESTHDTSADVSSVQTHGDKLNDKVNLDLLESQVNGVLGISESKTKLDKVGEEDADINNDGKVDDSDKYLKNKRDNITAAIKKEAMTESKLDKVGEEDADINNDGKVDDSDEYLKNRREKISSEIEKEAMTENAANIANIPHDAGKPSMGVDSADKFQQAVAVKQSEFVNSNTEHKVSETADEAKVDGNAEKAKTAMQSDAEKEIKAGLNDGGQNVPDKVISKSEVVTESSDELLNTGNGVDEDTKSQKSMQSGAKKAISASDVGKPNDEWMKGAMAFKSFVSSLKDGKNDNHMNAVLEAFDLITKK